MFAAFPWSVFERKVYTEREATAYHEAGHAYTAYSLRIRIVRVSIVADEREGSLGHLKYSAKFETLPSDLVQDRLRRIASVLMSGLLAEKLFTGFENFTGAASDLALLDGIARHLFPADSLEPELVKLWQETEARLKEKRSWAGITRLADHLLDIAPTIDGRKAMSLLKSWDDAVLREFP